MKPTIKLIIAAVVISFAGSFLSVNGMWIGFINFLFYISILLLMAGGSMVVLKGGMFNAIFYSFRRFYRGTSKLEKYVSEQTGEMQEIQIKKSLKDLYVYPIIVTGSFLFIFTLMAAFIS